jgi:hypothetical protein
VIPDVTLHSSVLFRLEGAPEAVDFTELAPPLGDLPIEERDLVEFQRRRLDGTVFPLIT